MGSTTVTPALITRLTDSGLQRFNLSNKSCPDANDIKGSIIFEIKTREKRSSGGSSASTGVASTSTSEASNRIQSDQEQSGSRFGHIPTDYFRRDGLHGPPLPKNYERLVTAQGQVYWRNIETKKSTWHDPRFKSSSTSGSTSTNLGPLPPDWEMLETETGRKYFVNHRTKTTQFTDPRLEIMTHSNRNRTRSSLHSKLKSLRAELLRTCQATHQKGEENVLRIDIDRNDVFESSFSQISQVPIKYFQKRFSQLAEKFLARSERKELLCFVICPTK